MSEVMNLDLLVERIKLKMDDLGVNQAKLAKSAGITPAALSQILSKDRTPSSGVLIKLSKALGVSMDYLVGQADNIELGDLLQDEGVQLFYRDFSGLTQNDQKTIQMMVETLKSKKGSE
jgi:transcriptional regulator with XRE-family HTH domain